MDFKRFSGTFLVSAFSAITAVGSYHYFLAPKQTIQVVENTPARYAAYSAAGKDAVQPIDMRYAASAATPTVVHIKSTYKAQKLSKKDGDQAMKDLFGDEFYHYFQGPNPYRSQAQVATGSGVIVSEDGYIVTNNHVVENADEIEVALHNNKTYKAKLIGKDEDTDLALIKIEGMHFPAASFSNSDSLMIGEWVMAVGNPFNLSSTVTAGIVSAKGRNINILGKENGTGSSTAIESFIQTDAAVNPGNSGGALVNVNGELVGINTAIASPTGTFAGYSFAVPSNIVKKVIFDLQKFGITQRGFLGVQIRAVDDEIANNVGLEKPAGVYVETINPGSAGETAGLKQKDIVTKINGISVNSAPELQEQVARYRPGDKISVEYLRDGKLTTTSVILKNKYNTTSNIDSNRDVLGILGIEIQELTAKEKSQLGINSGVKVLDLNEGKLSEFTDIKKGFIITQIDDQNINSVDDFTNAIKGKNGKILLEGIYPNKPMSYLYAFKM